MAEEGVRFVSDLLTTRVVTTGALALGCVLVGIIVDQLLYRALNSRFAKSGSAPGLTLAKALHGLPTAVGVLVALQLLVTRHALPGAASTFAESAVKVLTIVIITAFSARIVGRLVDAYTGREGTRLPSSSIFANLARGTVWALGGAAVLAALGISIAPIITALGVAGLAVGLALQPTLENVFSGVQVLASRQIEPGHFIRLETGEEGTVEDVTWRNTTIKRPSGELVIVPNSVIGRSLVTNFSAAGNDYGMGVLVSVSYGTDLEVVEQIALEVAREVIAEVGGAVRDSEPIVRFTDLTPPTVTFTTIIRVNSYAERIPARSEFIRRLDRRLSEAGIEAPPVAGVAAGPRGVGGSAVTGTTRPS